MSTIIVPGVDVVRSTFNFSVDKFPLSGPDGMKTPAYGLFRSDTGEFVGDPVTKKYVVHTTEDVATLTEAALTAFEDSAVVTAHWRSGHHVMVAPSKDYRRSIFGTADNVFPRFLISAGYDGKSFRASLGFWRDACLNMSILRQVSGTTVAIRHTRGLRDRMDELVGVFTQLRDGWKTLGDVIAELESRTVSLRDFLTELIPLGNDPTPRQITEHKKLYSEIFNRIERERFQTGRPRMQQSDRYTISRWEAYNAIQGNVQHNRNGRGNNSEFSQILYAADSPIVRKAEVLLLS
jgi:hypothetical protein